MEMAKIHQQSLYELLRVVESITFNYSKVRTRLLFEAAKARLMYYRLEMLYIPCLCSWLGGRSSAAMLLGGEAGLFLFSFDEIMAQQCYLVQTY